VSKAIKLEDKVYYELTMLMAPKETYSQVVERLLAIRLIAGGLSEALQGELKVKNHQQV
jgi:predicted CopG family antitoxin